MHLGESPDRDREFIPKVPQLMRNLDGTGLGFLGMFPASSDDVHLTMYVA